MRRKFLSILLVLCLGISLVPSAFITASAEDTGKTGRSLYTDDMVAAARDNIAEYSWAQTERDDVVKAADRFVALGAEYIWNNIPGQGIPRAYAVAFERGHPIRDPYEFHCRYCDTDLLEDHGNYPWTVDAINNPWKIKCPECNNVFPSNDFAKFYELGRTQENGGLFDRKTALEAHRAMLIEKDLLPADAKAMTSPGTDLSASWYKYYGYGVEGGYLHNDLYPEVGTAGCKVKFTPESGETTGRWGVDDGLGYNTGRKFDNGLAENHSYIPYYTHFGVWYFSGSAIAASALDKLGRAYLYTGDEKYGRLGAIILDRVADIYPSLNLKPYTMYPNSTGGSSDAGKDLGRIWGCFSAEIYAVSYDIFWPMYDDPEVISFLSQKASYYGMENDKTTAEKIRKNVADGTCREIFNACKKAWLYANFGIHQQAIIKAAIALDEPTETKAMIDWAFAASESDAHTYNTGGDISRNIIDIVYRDGNNAESPVYNQYAITELIDSAVALERYMKTGIDLGQKSLLSHPKYLKMINAFMPLTLVHRGLKGTGDAGAPAQYSYYPDIDTLIKAFGAIKDKPEALSECIKLAQQLSLRGVNGRYYDIFTPNAGSLKTDVAAIIDKYGQNDWDKSTIMTGYGYGIIREGTVKSVSYDGPRDTQRDFMLNFSAHPKHNHADMLDLGMEAYGIPFTSDFGYAEFMVTGDPHSNQLTSATIGHNTVVVNEVNSSTPSEGIPQYPLHFDAKDTRVKVIDARTPVAYASQGVDEYRRTVVMIDASDEVSYGVDFFHVSGGNDHLYTFMPNSNTRPESNLSFVKQVDQPLDTWKDEKNYYQTSSYAGPTVQFGRDPLKTPTSSYRDLMYPRGYTWFYDVEKCLGSIGDFYVDYKIEDFRGYSRNGNINPRLRITMVNDFNVNEVSLVSTIPQRIKTNEKIGHFEKVFIRRKGTDLDSLFTAVYEPYRGGNRYIDGISSVSVSVKSGSEVEGDEAKAVKVELEDGRIDYVVYATNKDVTYKVTDTETGYTFDFRGFIGVWTVDSETGDNVYSYLHDSEMLGAGSRKIRNRDAALTGTVVGFQEELSLDNWADVTFDQAISDKTAAELVDRMIIFEREAEGTGAYLIEGVQKTGENTARISFGSTSTIDGFVDAFDESKGYKYIIESGKSFEIPMSYESEAYDGKINYVFAHDAHFSTKGNRGTAYSDITKLGFDDTDPEVSTGAWGNLDSRNKQSLYASGMSSSLSVHRNGDFINLAFDPAKYNSTDGYYTYYSKLNESSASGPIAMIAIDVPKTGRYSPSMSALESSSSGQKFEVHLIKETDANKTLTAAQIREKLSLSDRIGAYDSSVGEMQKFGDVDLVAGVYYLAFVPVERGARTGSKNNGQVYLQPQSFHLDPVMSVDPEPYNPDALGGDGKLIYSFGAESFNSANKVYESGAEEPTWYFGDSVQNIYDYYTAVGKSGPTDFKKPVNTWSDQSAEAKARDKYIPWTANNLADGERGHVLWLRNNIGPYIYFGYSGVFERNYDYLNLARTDKWQYFAHMGNLDSAQVYSRSSAMHNQVKAGTLKELSKGNECTILKINIPTAAEYDFSINTMNSGVHAGFAAYLLPATKALPQTYEERLPYQIAVGEWDDNLKTGTYTAYTAGDYYFIFETFKTENTTTPAVGRWDVDLRSLTLTAKGEAKVSKTEETIAKEEEKAFTEENPAVNPVVDTSATVTVLAREMASEDMEDRELLERVIEKTQVEKAGDICTVEAPEIEGYSFNYWGVGLGKAMKAVSTDVEYSFKAPKGNTFLSAFYTRDDADKSVVEFYNADGEIISRKLYEEGEKIEIPALPSLVGVGDAIGWAGHPDTSGEVKIFGTDAEVLARGTILSFTAAYDEEEIALNKNVVVTVEGSTGITGGGEYAFGDTVTLTAPYRQNDGGFGIFVCWKKDGEVVSLDRTYSFSAATSCTVTAVYSAFLPTKVSPLRKIVVSAIGDNATVAEFIGCGEALERGFIFDGTGIEDASYKYAMSTDAPSFTMTYDTGLLPRAYAIFEDGVIYSK